MRITRARLRGYDVTELYDIAITADGTIESITESPVVREDSPAGEETIDADGGLVTESFVNGHLHLDKVYTLAMLGDEALSQYHAAGMGGAMTAIELASAVKKNYDRRWILDHVRRALDSAIRNGNTVIRAFADVDTTAKLEGVAALLEAREEYRDRVTVQVVAFPQDGIIRDPGAEELVREALVMGANCVGGIPWIELSDEDAVEHICRMMDLATEFDVDVSMLVDDAGDAGLRTTERLAVETIRRGFHGRVTAQHARAMSLYPEPYFRRLVALLRESRVSIVSDPHTGPLHARVRDLRSAGVTVALGQDDIEDAYYPFGRNNMLEVAFLAAHLLWMTSAVEIEALYDMITRDAARALGIENWKIEIGSRPDLVVLDATTVAHALSHHTEPRAVIRSGEWIHARSP